MAGRWISGAELAEHTARIFPRLRGFDETHGPANRPALFEALLLVAASVFRARGVSISVRKTKGRTIDAACGQLRRQLEQRTPTETEAVAVRTPRVSRSSAPA